MSSRSSPPDSFAAVPDLELVERARAGDRQAFGDLYQRHLSAIYRYIYYRVGDAAEAEDLTETVFVRAWEALGKYQPGGAPFLAWLYRIAHNLVIDQRRAHRETLPMLDEQRDSSPEHDPEAQAIEHDRQAALARWLRQLEPIAQQILTLRFISGLSHAETAQVVGRTEGSVRVLQHRALAALRRLAQQEGNSNDG